MGGHLAGEVASAAVVRRLAELGGSESPSAASIESVLVDAAADIELETDGVASGAGTTVTGVSLTSVEEEPIWRIFNIGDSRVYLARDERLVLLTKDHSLVQHLIDTGALHPDEAENHPHANIITRAVGYGEEEAPDFFEVPVTAR